MRQESGEERRKREGETREQRTLKQMSKAALALLQTPRNFIFGFSWWQRSNAWTIYE